MPTPRAMSPLADSFCTAPSTEARARVQPVSATMGKYTSGSWLQSSLDADRVATPTARGVTARIGRRSPCAATSRARHVRLARPSRDRSSVGAPPLEAFGSDRRAATPRHRRDAFLPSTPGAAARRWARESSPERRSPRRPGRRSGAGVRRAPKLGPRASPWHGAFSADQKLAKTVKSVKFRSICRSFEPFARVDLISSGERDGAGGRLRAASSR